MTEAAEKSEAKTAKELKAKPDTNNNSDDDDDDYKEEENLDEEDQEGVAQEPPQETTTDSKNPQDDNIADITEEIGTMSISKPPSKATQVNTKDFSMASSFPYIMYNYKQWYHWVMINFLVTGLPAKAFHPKVNSDGSELHLGMVIPPFLSIMTVFLLRMATTASL